jgi:hypothetical protein
MLCAIVRASSVQEDGPAIQLSPSNRGAASPFDGAVFAGPILTDKASFGLLAWWCSSFYRKPCGEVLDFWGKFVEGCGEFIHDGDCFSDSVMNLSGLLQEQV